MQITSSGYTSLLLPHPGPSSAGAPAPQPSSNAKSDPVDRVEISDAALQFETSIQVSQTNATRVAEVEKCTDCETGVCTKCGDKAQDTELSEEEQAQVKELKARDDEVRAHEAAHAAVGGAHAGSPSYEYQTGPDGKRYAIGGEVKIDAAPVDGDPRATIDKMRQVRAAALAPAEPSGQDKKVAAAAAAKLREAESELASQKQDELQGKSGENSDQGATINTQSDEIDASETTSTDTGAFSAAPVDSGFLQQMRDASRAYEQIAAFA